MPSILTTAANALAATHPFFTTYWTAAGGLNAKRLAAKKLLLYEVRGRPWNSLAADLKELDDEVTKWNPRPAFGAAEARVVAALNAFAAAPWTPGEAVLKRGSTFLAVYWAFGFSSGVQRPHTRQAILALEKLPSTLAVSVADRNRYTALKKDRDSCYANLKRAQLIMKYNAPDLPISLPGEALVQPPRF